MRYLYADIARGLAIQIRNGVLKPGDRLPSVRMLCQQHGISMNTAKRAFLELEAQSLVESRPQSGYFVSRPASLKLPLPETSKPSSRPTDSGPEELISKVYANMGRKDLTLFSIGVPSGNLLPTARLQKEIIQAARELEAAGAELEPIEGNVKLRRMVAQRSLLWGGNLSEDDLISTNGSMNALSFSLMTLGKPGDTIGVESPCYPGILQLALSLGYKVLELPTHPVTGIEIDALKKVIHKLQVCLLIPNFNAPLGSCMPDEHKKEVVALLARHGIPLIEDDTYGDLYFGLQRPTCCKSYDEEGNVLWCSAVSKTLAPGYRVGWIAPGRYRQQLLKMKLVHLTSSPAVLQEAVGSFLKNGRYDSHLRTLRRTLQENYRHYARVIGQHFPEGTRISRPQGGISLWVELKKGTDTAALYDLAIRQRISIAPGRMFTLQNQFENCMRLTLGLPWSDELETQLTRLGKLAGSFRR
jgi:DNA-binding transcriptional MocR family regulator